MSEGTNRGRSSSVRLGEWSARTLMKFMPSGMNAEFLICATFSFGSCGGEGGRSVLLVQNRRSTQTTAGTRDEENASAAGAGTHHHLSRHRPRSLRSRREHTERAANARVARRGLPEPKRRPVRVRPVAVSREHPNTVVTLRLKSWSQVDACDVNIFLRFDVETRRTRGPPANDSTLLSDTICTLDNVIHAEHLCTRRSHAASPAALGGSVGTSSGDSKSSNSGSANAFMGAYPSRRAPSPNPESNDPPCTLRR